MRLDLESYDPSPSPPLYLCASHSSKCQNCQHMFLSCVQFFFWNNVDIVLRNFVLHSKRSIIEPILSTTNLIGMDCVVLTLIYLCIKMNNKQLGYKTFPNTCYIQIGYKRQNIRDKHTFLVPLWSLDAYFFHMHGSYTDFT